MTEQKQMAISDFNLEKLNTKELADHIRKSIDIGGNIAIFGRRGTGKTEISKQQIKAAGMQEIYLNLSVMERVDLGGYPNVFAAQEGRKFVNFLMPQFYQLLIEGNKPGVLLLDEVDKADPSLWAPLLELTQFRSINGNALPNLYAIIMTGNLISEGGQRPSLPLLDRAEKYLVEADVTSWMTWAGKLGRIHPSITAFINDNPKDLFGAVDPGDRYSDPSPRGWTRFSDIITQGEERGWHPDLLIKKAAGCVGKEAGLRYALYYSHYQVLLPMLDKIFKGKDVNHEYKALDPSKQLIVAMMACSRLATHLDKALSQGQMEPPIALKYMGHFLRNVSHENVLASVRSQITIDRIVQFNLDENPDWQEILSDINNSVNK
jgi:hypothetical protein